MRDGRTAVIKIGGSILRDETSYRSAAHLLVDQIEREPTWAVVSAAHGMTDALETLAQTNSGEELRSLLRRQSWITGVAVDQYLEAELRETAGEALPRSRDRLLAWGERASVAALQTHLEREGVSVPIVELEEGAPPARRRAALVPGFYLRDRTGGYPAFREEAAISARCWSRQLWVRTRYASGRREGESVRTRGFFRRSTQFRCSDSSRTRSARCTRWPCNLRSGGEST